jgi:hypothetical protein
VLSIQSVLNSHVLVDLVYNPVGILLHTCRKYNYFIVLAQFCKEFDAKWSHQEIGVWAIVHIVD